MHSALLFPVLRLWDMRLFDESYSGRKDKCLLVFLVSQSTTHRGCGTERWQHVAAFAACHFPREFLPCSAGFGRGLMQLGAASGVSPSSPHPLPVPLRQHQAWWQGCSQEHRCRWEASWALQLGSCCRRSSLSPFPACCRSVRWVPILPCCSWAWGSLAPSTPSSQGAPFGLLQPESGTSYRSACKMGELLPVWFQQNSQSFRGGGCVIFWVFEAVNLQPGEGALWSSNYSSVVFFNVICATHPAGSQSASFYCLSKYSVLMTRIILNSRTAYYTAAGHSNREHRYKAVVLTVGWILKAWERNQN